MVTAKESVIVPDGLCAPVHIAIFRATYVTDIIPVNTTYEVIFEWGDGNVDTIAAFINDSVSPPEISAISEYAYQPREDGSCTYEATASLSINGQKCTSSSQSQLITVWDQDDRNGGVLSISPAEIKVCTGEEAVINFMDSSVWNCTSPELDKPNYEDRKVRWRYGTDDSPSDRIKGIVLTKEDGSTVDDISSETISGDVLHYHDITTGPTTPNNTSWSIYIPPADVTDVGKVYEVTLDIWNYCNPYPTSEPASTTARIVIVEKPIPEILPVGAMCDNHEPVELQIVSGSAPGNGIWRGTGVTGAVFDPAVAGAGTHKIWYEETVNNCTIVDSIEVTVYASPSIDFSLSTDSGCTPLEIELTNRTSEADIYEWDFGDDNTSENVNDVHEFINVSDSVKYYQVTLTASNQNNCYSRSSQTVTVYPYRDFDFTIEPDFTCNPGVVSIYADSGAISYSWDFGNGLTLSGDKYNTIQTFNNTGEKDTAFQVSLIASSVYGCKDTTVRSVTVKNSVDAELLLSDSRGCSPLNTKIENLSSEGCIYYWDYGDGRKDTTLWNDSFNVTYVNNGTTSVVYNLKLTVELGECRDSVIYPVEVFPSVTADFTGPATGCSPLNIQFADISTGADYIEMDFGDGSPLSINEKSPDHTYYASYGEDTTYFVTLNARSSFGCEESISKTIHVKGTPLAQFKMSVADTLQAVKEVEFYNLSKGGALYEYDLGGLYSYSSTSKDTISRTFPYSDSETEDYEMQLVATGSSGCRDTFNQTLYGIADPVALYEADTVGCSPFNVLFKNNSERASSYIWDFGDGSSNESLAEPQHTFTAGSGRDTSYWVRLTAVSPYGKTAQDSVEIHVKAAPVADFHIPVPVTCAPSTTEFSDLSTNADILEWDMGDGVVYTNPGTSFIHEYNNETTNTLNYYVVLTASRNGLNSSCRSTKNNTVTVHPEVTAAFRVDTAGCSPHNVLFENNSASASSYTWDFGDGSERSNNLNSDHVYISPAGRDTIYTAMLMAVSDNNCRDTLTREITVRGIPDININYNSLEGCSPFEIVLDDNTSLADSVHYDFGEGFEYSSIAGESVNYVYENKGTTPLTFELKINALRNEGCADSIVHRINVLPEVKAAFIADTIGCSPLTSNLENLSEGADSYQWEFGDGITSADFQPDHIFSNNGIADTVYKLRLKAYSGEGCTDSVTYDILVHPTPDVDFNVTPLVQTYPDSKVELINTTTPAGPWRYTWDFGDNSGKYSGDIESYLYEKPGEYIIELKGEGDFCKQFITKKINILHALPIASFAPDTSGCPPLEVQFRNSSDWGTSYEWDFGDGNYSSIRDPFHIYTEEGKYIVTLRVFNDNNDVSVANSEVNVNPEPKAFFTPIPEKVMIPGQVVYFSNQSENANACVWDFGDGMKSTEYSPEYHYTTSGTYDVSLTVRSLENCTDTFTLEKGVVAEAQVRMKVPNAFTPAKDGSNGGNYVLGDIYNRVFHPIVASGDVAEYLLQIYNRWGNLLFSTRDINKGWDGYYQGKLCSQDVYVWRIVCKFRDGFELVESGDITLLQ